MGLFSVFIAMITGILLSGMNPVVPLYAFAGMASLFLFSLVAVKNEYVWILLISAIVLMLSMACLSSPSTQCADEVVSYAAGKKVSVSGWIAESVVEYPDREKILLKIDKLDNRRDRSSGCLIQLLAFNRNKDSRQFIRGDYIDVSIKPRKPKNLKNPGSFDYRDSLAKKGIGLVAYSNKKGDISSEPDLAEKGIPGFIDSIRVHIKDVIARNTNDQTVFGIVSALVIGDQGYISRDIRRIFASTGIIHILVVAGLHLAIITHLFYLLVKFLLSRSRYMCIHTNIPKLSLALSTIPMLVYIFISGAKPPVVRSGIMIAVYCFLFLINKTQARWTGILIAAILILAINPMAVYSISFQLSFIAVGSIIACMPAITGITSALNRRTVKPFNKIITAIVSMLLVSFFVTLGLGGVIAFYFNTLPLFGIMLNVIVIPFFCYLVLPLSLFSSAVGFVFPWLSHYLFIVISLLVHTVVQVIRSVSDLSIASIRVPTPTLFEIFLYYAFMIVLLNVKRIGLKTAMKAASFLFLLQAVDTGYYVYKTHFNSVLTITFIDVGQGDSALIEFPYGRTMLIDAGGGAYRSYDTGEAVVARYLWSLKRNGIDYVVSSHPQMDHIGGLGFMVKNMGVHRVYKSDCEPDTVVYKDFMHAVLGSNAVTRTIKNSIETFYVNGVRIELLSVPHEACDPSSKKDINNYAVLTKITYKDVSVLFTGDIEKDAELALVGAYPAVLKSDIMKSAHHGSKTSSTEEFMDAVDPKIVVIPVGEDNPFHMPSKVVLKRLFERNIRVLRTDRDGAISIITDGKYIKIKKFE
jgi:competence protein ComEC